MRGCCEFPLRCQILHNPLISIPGTMNHLVGWKLYPQGTWFHRADAWVQRVSMEEILGLLFGKSFPEADMEKLHSFQQVGSFIISSTSDHPAPCPHSAPNLPKSLGSFSGSSSFGSFSRWQWSEPRWALNTSWLWVHGGGKQCVSARTHTHTHTHTRTHTLTTS